MMSLSRNKISTKHNDINWINVVKALCIMLVFLRHSESYYGISLGRFDGLYLTIYVNAFFFVSGYLLYWKQLSEPKMLESVSKYITGGGKALFLNVLYRIVIPSVIFSVIEFVPSCIIQGRGIDIGFALYKTIGGGTYWFTSALAVSELILLLLFFTRKKNIWFYSVISFTLCIVGLLIVQLGIFDNGIWAWRQGLIALSFLAMGGLYWRYEGLIDKLRGWWSYLLLLLIYIAIIFNCNNTNPLISTLGIQPLGFFTSLVGCVLIIWFCKSMPQIRQLTFIGRNSIGFYFMSGALPITISLIVHKLMEGIHLWMMLAIWVVCVVVAYVAVIVINRLLPWLFDLRLIKPHQG